jgi:Ulp1 family protease
MLATYIGEVAGEKKKGNDLVDMVPCVVKMPWRNIRNVHDCGIYMMRHMETFMGDRKWNCGLKKKTWRNSHK